MMENVLLLLAAPSPLFARACSSAPLSLLAWNLAQLLLVNFVILTIVTFVAGAFFKRFRAGGLKTMLLRSALVAGIYVFCLIAYIMFLEFIFPMFTPQVSGGLNPLC